MGIQHEPRCEVRLYPPFLETPRLRFFRVQDDDLQVLTQIYGDADTMRFLSPPWTRAQMQDYLDGWQCHWEKHGFGCGMLVDKESRQVYGTAGLFNSNVPGEVALEIGFMLLPCARKRGFATEITRALLDYAFTSLSATRVVADPHKDHVASNRVFEKLGFVSLGEREANLPNFPFCSPQRLWEMTAARWSSLHSVQ